METYGVKTISVITMNNPAYIGLKQGNVDAAKKVGLKTIRTDALYEANTTDFFPLISKVVKEKPDAIDLTLAGAGEAAQMVKAARQLGYKGIIMDVVAGDENVFNEVGGKYMEGFVTVGGATTEESRTEEMAKFMKAYNAVAGEWNDEAATKLYAMEMLRATLQVAGAAALTDNDVFRAAVPKVKYKNPYIKGNPILKYIGKSTYGHSQQVGVPIVIVEMRGGKYKVVKIAHLE